MKQAMTMILGIVLLFASAQRTLAKARSDDLQKWWDECAYDANALSTRGE